ncbi:MAG: superoxide dismutase [Candidatus Staskawiczbacteria bacterium]|nr:superoxide dismutase [Candidatus Staskawiczbacteria bacterium]
MQKYELPKLPYEYGDLEPYISKEIMEVHYGKHHATYVNNLNVAVEKHPELFEKSPEELLMNLNEIPEDIRTAVKNSGGGVVNHSFFWKTMAPHSAEASRGKPAGKLADAIEKQFGSFAEFQQKFNDEGLKRFGSGWVWLTKDKSGKLEIISTANQDSPISEGKIPLMANDVWEHAYYLQYKNLRGDYLKAWWNVVNWPEVEKRFLK